MVGPVTEPPGHPLLFKYNGSPATGNPLLFVRVLPLHSPAQPGNPLLMEWVLSPSSPVARRLSASKPRGKAPRNGAARRQDPLQEQRVPRLRWAMQGQD